MDITIESSYYIFCFRFKEWLDPELLTFFNKFYYKFILSLIFIHTSHLQTAKLLRTSACLIFALIRRLIELLLLSNYLQ